MAEQRIDKIGSDEGLLPHHGMGRSKACVGRKSREKREVERDVAGETSSRMTLYRPTDKRERRDVVELGCRSKGENREKPYWRKERQMRATKWLRQPA